MSTEQGMGATPRFADRIRSLREEVTGEVRRMILDGELPPGDFLNESALATELGVSRLPVREAFRQLEVEGLLVSVARRGVRVTELDPTDFEVIYEARLGLELLALRLAIRRNDPAARAALEEALQAGEKACTSGDRATLGRLNAEFHGLLAQSAGSRSLAELLRLVRQQSELHAGGLHSPAAVSWEEHAAIMRAVLERDSRAAVARMRAHLAERHAAVLAARS